MNKALGLVCLRLLVVHVCVSPSGREKPTYASKGLRATSSVLITCIICLEIGCLSEFGTQLDKANQQTTEIFLLLSSQHCNYMPLSQAFAVGSDSETHSCMASPVLTDISLKSLDFEYFLKGQYLNPMWNHGWGHLS